MLSPALEDSLVSFLVAALCASASQGMPREALLRDARQQVTRDLTDVDLGATLRALADKRLVSESAGSIGLPRWRITDLGRDVAREKGLA